MAIQVPSFLVPFADTPKPDISWLDGIAQAGGDIIGEMGMRKSMGKLGATLNTPSVPAGQPQGSFLSNLVGNNRPQASVAPVAPMARSAVPNQPPIPGIQRQAGPMDGYRNAIASIESAGSGDYAAVGPTHPKLGRALGRYQVMEANIGPWSQEVLGRSVTPEEFMANPQLQDAIFDGKFQQYVQKFGPEGAAQAWFGGEGGVGQTARTDSLGTSIGEYGNKFTNALGASGGSVDAVNAMGAGGQVPGYVDPMVVNPNSRPQAAAQPMAQPMPANQVADASGNVLAPAVTPVQRGSISPDTIRSFLQDPNLRQIGVELWKQNVQGPQAGEPWQFVTLPDGTLARANQQTGSVERIGNFAKPAEPKALINLGDGRLFDPNNREVIDAGGNRKKAPQIVELFDDQTGQPYKARWNEETGAFDRVGGVKAPSGTQITTNPDGTMTMTQGPIKDQKFTEAQSKDNVYATRAAGALETADAYADKLASVTDSLLDRDPTGVARGNLQDPDYQVARAAADEFLHAILRKDTGAAITEQEQVLYGRTYFPVPGDGPEVRAYKQQARRRALAAIESGMSPAQMIAKERALAKSNGINLDAPARAQNAPANAPAVGAVEDGYRFKGGDPSNPNSWEQVN